MVLGILQGFEAPAGAWESEILRVRATRRTTLPGSDMLSASWGAVVWGRLDALGGARRECPDEPDGGRGSHEHGWDVWHRTPDASWQRRTRRGDGGARALVPRAARASVLRRDAPEHGAPPGPSSSKRSESWRGDEGRVGVRRQLRRASRSPSIGLERRDERAASGKEAGRLQPRDRGALVLSLLRSRDPGAAYDESAGRGDRARSPEALGSRDATHHRPRGGPLPPWRDLLVVYRRLEAQGEIPVGWRFVAGFTGLEQYRAPRGCPGSSDRRGGSRPAKKIAVVSAADRAQPDRHSDARGAGRLPCGNRIALRGGLPVAVREGERRACSRKLAPLVDRDVRAALVRRGRTARGGRAPAPVRPLAVRALGTR